MLCLPNAFDGLAKACKFFDKMVLKFSFFLFFFLAIAGFAQGEEIIPWSADRKLQWSDFKGKYLKTEWAAATTASSISYKFSTYEKDGQVYVDFVVGCEFYPKKSWYRPDMVDDLILSHEQLHFDIAELHARKFRKRLAETRFTANIKEEVREIYKEVLKELYIFQNRYDHETNFSRDTQKQMEWNKMIAEALEQEAKLP
ncbi:protein of unknown function [Pseudozobellia thermophila]|uniref:DUF922 domain-containing protein n=2 Tax=Pseudozobellia thermophila TaxID=192903 RepID=A0A1M6MM20_9FLAO|nr:protein of unknown function [Pseudozobellia thermophila]